MTISVFVFSTKFNLILFMFIHAVYVFLPRYAVHVFF